MPRTIDQEAIESPTMQILDINNPPTKAIGYEPFPKMLYLHPKDKTKEHRTMTVNNSAELDAAEKIGWKTKPHNPETVVEDLSEHFEAEPVKRGPGRPANGAA